ncbi:hypothetical protein PUN28_000920 [Cardiocondyla obscurior]|uniref:Uncharacterized protein n=1 Tax=Cardiocondyla obscurior TaxID=286306 RepID=A0AAW2H1R9_9HYME
MVQETISTDDEREARRVRNPTGSTSDIKANQTHYSNALQSYRVRTIYLHTQSRAYTSRVGFRFFEGDSIIKDTELFSPSLLL